MIRPAALALLVVLAGSPAVLAVSSNTIVTERKAEPIEAAGYGILAASPVLILLGLGILAADGPEITGPLTALFLGVAAAAAYAGVWIGGTSPQDEWIEAEWPHPTSAATVPDAPPDSARAAAADTTNP